MPSQRKTLVGYCRKSSLPAIIRCATGRGDDRTEAEAGDRDTGDEAPLVREPLLQHGDRHDVGQAETEATEHAVAEDEQPQVGGLAGEAREDDAERVDDDTGGRDEARSLLVLDPPAEEGADEDHADAGLERQ